MQKIVRTRTEFPRWRGSTGSTTLLGIPRNLAFGVESFCGSEEGRLATDTEGLAPKALMTTVRFQGCPPGWKCPPTTVIPMGMSNDKKRDRDDGLVQ